MVVHRSGFERTGLFDTSVGEATDTEMWVRLFSRYGVRCVPYTTCAYTIHEGAITDGMWNPGTIRAVQEIFDRAVALQFVPEPTIRRWQADFVHQFILAGAYRRLRVRRMAEGREVLRFSSFPRSAGSASRQSGCPFAPPCHRRHHGGAPEGLSSGGSGRRRAPTRSSQISEQW